MFFKKKKLNKGIFADVPIPINKSMAWYKGLYINYIKKDPKLLNIYKKWIISNIFILDSDSFYELRKRLFISDNEINPHILYFLFDLFKKFIFDVTNQCLLYYKIIPPKSNNNITKEILCAFKLAIEYCDKKTIEKQGFSDFFVAVIEYFKCTFYNVFEVKPLNIYKITNDDTFVKTFENEWKKLYQYSDNLYGFNVIPLLTRKEFLRYLKLPFEKQEKYGHLSQTKKYKEIMNYFVGQAFFKPLPLIEISYCYQKDLTILFKPLIDNLVKEACKRIRKNEGIKDPSYIQNFREKIKLEFVKEFEGLKKNFDFFYITWQKIKKNKKNIMKPLMAPIGKYGQMVHLGQIFDSSEYPFTAFVENQLKSKLDLWIEKKKKINYKKIRPEKDELDKIEYKERIKMGSKILQGTPKEIEETEKKYSENKDIFISTDSDSYDFKDKNGNTVGWLAKTFAGKVSVSYSTLRRWDRKNQLKAKRGGKYKFTKYKYRYYVKNDIKKAEKLKEIGQKKMRHRI